MDKFFQKYASNKRLTDQALAELFEQRLSLATDSSVTELLSTIKQLVGRRGKRLRPLLTIMAYRSSGGARNNVLPVAVSQELVHSFLLIHDDIIDDDLERHEGPNIAGHYTNSWQLQPQIANNYALLAGDLCFSLANELLATSDFEPPLIQAATLLVQQTVTTVIEGQLQQMSLSHQAPQAQTTEQVLQIYRRKTASYSFVCPLQLGALLAGASSQQLSQIASVAEPLGVAYQIKDDLDEFSTDHGVKDLRQGMLSLITNLGLQLASPTDQALIKQALANPDLGPPQAQVVAKILTGCGAIDKARQIQQQQLKLAQHQLQQSSLNSAFKEELALLFS